MIALEQAVAIVDQVTFNPETETISIMDSLGRVLAEDIISKINMPPFNKSAMDGYAISQEDNSKKFMVVETIAAGSMPTKTIHQGQCSKIMTGAPPPPGADMNAEGNPRIMIDRVHLVSPILF